MKKRYADTVARALNEEFRLLADVEATWRVRVQSTMQQLNEWATQPLPDSIPRAPQWIGFEWPMSGNVNFERYWREVDRQRSVWERERL